MSDMKVAIIGLDTSHSVAMPKLMNDPTCEPDMKVSGLKAVTCLRFETPFQGKEGLDNRQAQLEGWGVKVTLDFDEAIADCDAIMMEINDPAYHLDYFKRLANLGKPIFLDKPMVIPLSDIDGMKLTMARYYTPSDVNIDKIGIPPDYEIKNIEDMTPEEEEAYTNLVKSNIITETVEKTPNMTENDISKAAKSIAKTYPIDERLIRRLLRIQVQRTQVSPLYDLDYDVQLAKAIEIIQNNNFNDLMRKTKTLKELQDEALAQEQETLAAK